jgi:hypothetical protein
MLIQGSKATAVRVSLCVLLFVAEAWGQAIHHRVEIQAKPNRTNEHAKPSPLSDAQRGHIPPGSDTQNGRDIPSDQRVKPSIHIIPKWPTIHMFSGLAPVRLSPAEARLRGDSRKAWDLAVDDEKQSIELGDKNSERMKFQRRAYEKYEQSVNDLEGTKNSQRSLLAPETYVPLAKSHMDAARMLYLLGENPAAESEVLAAESLLRDLLLNQDPTNPLWNGWLWRIYYLLGDANFYENSTSIALFYYQKAQSLKPNFAPASAMAQYLAEGVQPIQFTSMPGSVEPPITTLTPLDLTARDKLLQMMKAISASKSLNQAASFVSLAATLLETTELAPVAASLTLSAMIIDYAVKTTP